MGPVAGVAATLEFCEEAKLAGWKRGREGSRSAAAVPDECWRLWGTGRTRREDEGMPRFCILGDSGEPGGGMVCCFSAERGDMSMEAGWWFRGGDVVVMSLVWKKRVKVEISREGAFDVFL